MNFEHLIQPAELLDLIQSENCVVADCSFDLAQPGKGREDWQESHIPTASYWHLDEDLASPITPDSGRHPLPHRADFALRLANAGWAPGKLLVAYDSGSSAIAARMRWMMKYFGQNAAILDGGFAAWKQGGLPLEAGQPEPTAQSLTDLTPDQSMVCDVDEIVEKLGTPGLAIVDARAAERFSGEFEPLDSRGGHIPGAINRPLSLNLNANGQFKSPEELRSEFSGLLTSTGDSEIVHSCGSGVTACHNAFAMELAGLDSGRVFPGSWSQWVRDPSRPVETS